jgi:hypothetical protein
MSGRAVRRTGLLFALALVTTVPPVSGCSDEPDELADPDLPVVATNPDGDPYPTDRLGGTKRGLRRPGDRIPNFAFRAYRSGRGAGLETVSLAEYYDPQQKRHKLLHLQVAATWCAICSAELTATMTVVDPLRQRGVVFVEVIVSGATAGKGPSLDEVDAWVDRHKTTFPTGIDVRARRLGALGVNGAAMPHDILIDTRTMEILDSSVGAPLDVGKYVLDGLKIVTENPPAY